ncbi:MAG TPA: hypothetical protein VFW34_05185 [Candidatus Rubrimentiphilum sp.]|nr:hypothetical protein [Candidatus Rubrimentiphilum sp.]
MRATFSWALLLLALSACGTPQRLPLEIPRCDAVKTANGITLTALVTSEAAKPISGLAVSVDFYHDFRTATLAATTTIAPELDPGQQRSVVFKIAAPPAQAQGRALRCLATHISYLDGTSENVAPAR